MFKPEMVAIWFEDPTELSSSEGPVGLFETVVTVNKKGVILDMMASIPPPMGRHVPYLLGCWVAIP
jgi:hypothetical protein